MKKISISLLLVSISFSLIAQLTFDRPQLNNISVVSGNGSFKNEATANNNKEKIDGRFANLNFEGRLLSDNKVKIIWIAPAAYQSASFVVQKSYDGKIFEDIIKTPAKISPEKGVVYSLLDPVAFSQTSYYRIIEMKEDGAMKTSDPIMIGSDVTNTTAVAKISFTKKEGKNLIQLSGNYDFNNADVMVATGNSEMGIVCDFKSDKEGELTLIPAYDLPAGDYVVKLREATNTKRIKFSVKDDESVLK